MMSLYLASIYFQTERSLYFLSKLNVKNARDLGMANARYNACCAATWDEKKFPFKYLLEYEHYAGKICKMFTDKPIKRKRREHTIEGQESFIKECDVNE